MATYKLTEREIPLAGEYDVIVCGGGPAGCTAATAAARDGAKTLLVEATGSLGGMGTNGLVPSWCPFSDKEKMIYRGLAERVFHESKQHVLAMAAKPERLDWINIDAENVKQIFDRMVTGAGADLLFFTQVCGVEKAGDDTLDAVLVANKAGLSAYRAKVWIDCTGDADLAAWAGAPFQVGDASGEVQPVTHCFTLTNVDHYAYQYGPTLMSTAPESPMHAIFESGKWPLIKDKHIVSGPVGPNAVGFNAGHLWEVDSTDPVCLSRAMVDGRMLAQSFRDALAEYYPAAFGNALLARTGTLMGVRESRRIVGDYVLTIDDYLARKSFPDEICRNAYPVDIHTTKDEAEHRTPHSAMDRYERYKPGESHGLPYRCLAPQGLRNVLVAGRSISTDRPVQGSTRVMPVCLCMGEAAGAAAAMALEATGGDIHAVDTDRLRERLREAGAWLP